MIDLHTHVLPGVDDGPNDLTEAIELLEGMRDDGVREVVATPHFLPGMYEPEPSAIDDALERVRGEIQGIQLHPGREIRLAGPEVVERIRDGGLAPLGDAERYVLIEFPFAGIPVFGSDALERIHDGGLIPVVAHPERIAEVRRSPDTCERLLESGAVLQVNAGSVLGRGGEGNRRTARKLFRRGWVSFLASDAHHPETRSPRLTEALEVLESEWEIPRPRRFVADNPRAVLEGRDLPTDVSSTPS